jgi:hypothetical protein
MRRLARGLQMVALVLLPLSMILQIAHTITVGQMLMIMVAGFCLFWIGRLAEGFLGVE